MQIEWSGPLFFIALWLGVSALLSMLSGWRTLANSFRTSTSESAPGETFSFVSGSMGFGIVPVGYGRCWSVTVNARGFGLSMPLPFSFLSPPLFVPWDQVESVEERRTMLRKRAIVRIRGRRAVIAVQGKAGVAMAAAYARAASIGAR